MSNVVNTEVANAFFDLPMCGFCVTAMMFFFYYLIRLTNQRYILLPTSSLFFLFFFTSSFIQNSLLCISDLLRLLPGAYSLPKYARHVITTHK